MSGIPICRECAHLVGVRVYKDEAPNWKCAKSADGTTDSVTGTPLYKETCYQARLPAGGCGPEGKLFAPTQEPKPWLYASKPGGKLPTADDLLGELGL